MLHSEIFNLLYYGKGGFTWECVYSMPIFLRRFYIKKINETITAENAANEKSRKSISKKTDSLGITPTRK